MMWLWLLGCAVFAFSAGFAASYAYHQDRPMAAGLALFLFYLAAVCCMRFAAALLGVA